MTIKGPGGEHRDRQGARPEEPRRGEGGRSRRDHLHARAGHRPRQVDHEVTDSLRAVGWRALRAIARRSEHARTQASGPGSRGNRRSSDDLDRGRLRGRRSTIPMTRRRTSDPSRATRGRPGRRPTRRTASSRRMSSSSPIRSWKRRDSPERRPPLISSSWSGSRTTRYGSAEGYELRILGLNVYRPDGRTLIWRGTASGSISTDAASGDLNKAVQGILAAFPPK